MTLEVLHTQKDQLFDNDKEVKEASITLDIGLLLLVATRSEQFRHRVSPVPADGAKWKVFSPTYPMYVRWDLNPTNEMIVA